MTPKQKLWTGIGVGVVLVGGGIATAIYFNKKDEESRDGGSGSGNGSGGSSASPCASRPESNECKKEKCKAIIAVSGRGNIPSSPSLQLIECKRLLGMQLNPCEVRSGSNECLEWQKKQLQAVIQGRGFDGGSVGKTGWTRMYA